MLKPRLSFKELGPWSLSFINKLEPAGSKLQKLSDKLDVNYSSYSLILERLEEINPDINKLEAKGSPCILENFLESTENNFFKDSKKLLENFFEFASLEKNLLEQLNDLSEEWDKLLNDHQDETGVPYDTFRLTANKKKNY